MSEICEDLELEKEKIKIEYEKCLFKEKEKSKVQENIYNEKILKLKNKHEENLKKIEKDIEIKIGKYKNKFIQLNLEKEKFEYEKMLLDEIVGNKSNNMKK